MWKTIFPNKHTLIGMIHLPPLPSQKGSPGIDVCINKALHDLQVLEKTGFDAALIENNADRPHTVIVNKVQRTAMEKIAKAVSAKAHIAIGVQLLLNDWKASIDICKESSAAFTRIDVFVDHVLCKWAEINPNPEKIVSYKNSQYAKLLLLTDIQVKHKTLLKEKPLALSASEALSAGSDALIITGNTTGQETPIASLQQIQTSFPEAVVLVGAGLCSQNIQEQMKYTRGGIVGTSIKEGEFVNKKKAEEIIHALNKLKRKEK